MMRRTIFAPAFWPCALTFLAALSLLEPASAQTRFTYSKGQHLAPTYEGWMPNEDGSFTLYFGYINMNWLEEFDVPVGADNDIAPGGPDQGQPTHFYPRRNPFLFTVRVPKDFGTKELIWTLTVHGRSEKAYASLKTDYQIDKQVISTEVGGDFGSLRDELRDNLPPELEVAGETQRTVKLGEPLTLVALAGDPDNIPARRDGRPQPRHAGKPIEEAANPRLPRKHPPDEGPPPPRVPHPGHPLHWSWKADPACACPGSFTAGKRRQSVSIPNR